MYCIYFYAEYGIDLGSFYLLEVKDLKDIFPITILFGTMLKPGESCAKWMHVLQKSCKYSGLIQYLLFLMCQYSVNISYSW